MREIAKRVVIVGAGQSGLAAAAAAKACGLKPVVLEAGDRAAGSWPHYYDSLRLFSPAEFSSIDGVTYAGDEPDRYPTGDEVADYLVDYAESLDAEIRTGTRVTGVGVNGEAFTVDIEGGEKLSADAVIAATGSFGNPYVPSFAGQQGFKRPIKHVADYRNPTALAGQRIVVVGAGNSAVQVAYELGQVADVTLAVRRPVTWMPQRREGHDMHYWLRETGFDDLPPAWLAKIVTSPPVVDDGNYGQAEAGGIYDQRPMFDRLDGNEVVWSDGNSEPVDLVLLATGYRPHLPYLQGMGALDAKGLPLHYGGLSTTHRGLAYVGLDFQRTFASNTLRGARRDADWVMNSICAHVGDAASLLQLAS